MKTSYHIGELARYFGISADTLRMYDKKGIISPCKEENGYRVYSREDMIFLDYVLRLRKLGLPLKEVKQLIGNNSLQDMEHVCRVQSRRLLDRADELYALYAAAQDYSNVLRETWENLGDIRIDTCPRMILRTIDDSSIGAVEAFKKLGGGIMPWFCILTGADDFLADDSRFNPYDYEVRNSALKNAVIVIDHENTIRVPDEVRDEFVIFEPRKCVYMAARGSAKKDYEGFLRIRKFVLENKFTATGDMISICIAVRSGASGNNDYYQVYLPIE